MPYQFDPASYSYVWYEEGTQPPAIGQGEDFIPGYSDYYNASQSPRTSSTSYDATTGTTRQNGTLVIDMDSPTYQNQSSAAGATSTSSGQTTAQRDAYEYLSRIFGQYGLSSLAPKILDFVQQGYGADTIALMLQDTSEYKQRFKANQTRLAAGLPVLSPAEYLSLESSYRQILEGNGLPKGFYDSQDDFAAWIGGDVSPTEIQARARLAADAVHNSDTDYLQTLREYGLGEGDLVAAMLDRGRAMPLLEKTVREAQIGAEARRQGLMTTQARAGQWESMGVTRDQAREAYSWMGANLDTLENLGDIYGEDYSQADAEDELLGASGMASQRRRRLQARETSSFAGTSAVGQNTFAGPSRGEF